MGPLDIMSGWGSIRVYSMQYDPWRLTRGRNSTDLYFCLLKVRGPGHWLLRDRTGGSGTFGIVSLAYWDLVLEA